MTISSEISGHPQSHITPLTAVHNDDRMAYSDKTARSSPFLACFLGCWLIHFVSHGWAPLPTQSHWVSDMGSSVRGELWSHMKRDGFLSPVQKTVSPRQLTCWLPHQSRLCRLLYFCSKTAPMWSRVGLRPVSCQSGSKPVPVVVVVVVVKCWTWWQVVVTLWERVREM